MVTRRRRCGARSTGRPRSTPPPSGCSSVVEAARRRAARRARLADLDARRTLPAGAHRARPRQRATSIIACAARFPRPGERSASRRCSAARSPSSSRRARVLVVGSNLRKEVPLIAHRLRKAARAQGAKVAFVNPQPLRVPVPGRRSTRRANGLGMAEHLAGVLLAAAGKSRSAQCRAEVDRSARRERAADRRSTSDLREHARRRSTARDPARRARAARSGVRGSARARGARLPKLTGATLGYLPEGGNAVGACLAGVAAASRRRWSRRARAGLNVARHARGASEELRPARRDRAGARPRRAGARSKRCGPRSASSR